MPRKKLDIDKTQVEKLAEFGATNTEIGGFFNCDPTTIAKRFSNNLTKGRSERKIRLRKMQWLSAESGNVTMQIWLGKNELGQADKRDLDVTITDFTIKRPDDEADD